MNNLSSISMNAAVSLLILVIGVFAYETSVRQPQAFEIRGPVGESRQLPIDLLRLRSAMW